MTETNTDNYHDDLRAVAGEYVLDTLSVREKSAFEALLVKDPSIISMVDEWKTILQPVLESAPDEQPDASVWLRIKESLDQTEPEQPTVIAEPVVYLENVRKSRNRWRGFSGGLVSLAAGLAAFVLIDGSLLEPRSVVPDQMAVLTAETTGIQFIATVDPSRQGVHIRPVNQDSQSDPFANGSLELWVKTGQILRYLGEINSASWQWLNYSEILTTEEFDNATLLLSRHDELGTTSQKAPGEIVFRGEISSRSK